MDYEEDFEVVRKVQSGMRNEFRHLVRKHQSYVYTMILRQVGDKALAEELAQETFLRAYRGIKGFSFNSAFSTWLTRIALNQSKSYFRSRRFKEGIRQEPYVEQTHAKSTAAHPEADLLLRENLSRLQTAIAQLSEKHREVLVLCALEKKSYDEAAEVLSLPVGTVRSRLNRARQQLKELYFEESHGN